MSLAHVPLRSAVQVTGLRGANHTAIRLMELGVIEGARIEVLGRAPLGDPIRVRLGDSELSLRHSEADLIDVAAI